MVCPKGHDRSVLNYEECDARLVAERVRGGGGSQNNVLDCNAGR